MTQNDSDSTAPVPPLRALVGGFLMGVANLFPGVSGGTMILALGLYDKVIGAIAELSSLRWRVPTFVFIGTMGVGLAVALFGLSGITVALVVEHRWIMYSVFIGLTLGGVPELWRAIRPLGTVEVLAAAIGFGAMLAFFFGLSDTRVPQTTFWFVLVGMLAASSMILPGISGSTVLLVLGMYELVWGSISSSALKADFMGSLRVLVPIGIGAALGIALLSNVLKFALARWRGPSHAALLGLLIGSLAVLVPPFQAPVHQELAARATRKAVELVAEGKTAAQVTLANGYSFAPGEYERLRLAYGAKSQRELKEMSLATETFEASPVQWGIALLLVVLGFGFTQLLGYKDAEHGD